MLIVISKRALNLRFLYGTVAGVVVAGLVGLPLSAQSVTQLTDLRIESQIEAAIDDAGDIVVSVSSVDDFGTNPSNAFQVVVWDRVTGISTQLTNLSRGVGGVRGGGSSISVTDDGQTIAFISSGDPVGLNADGSREVFVSSVDGSSLTQLTVLARSADLGVGAAQISGSGNRVAFTSSADPLGSNGSGVEQLFIVDTSGSNLTQLTSAVSGTSFRGFSISDDGTKLVFSHDGNLTGANPTGERHVFFVGASGAPLGQATSSTSENEGPLISGDGSRFVYYTDSGVWSRPTLGGQPILLIGGLGSSLLSITDDGDWVYMGGSTVLKVSTADASWTQLIDPLSPLESLRPVVSGDGARIVMETTCCTSGSGVPDDGQELYLMNSDGTQQEKISDNQGQWFLQLPDVSRDGSRAVFLGGPELDNYGTELDLYSIRTDGSDLVRLTTSPGIATWPRVSADGEIAVFESAADQIGDLSNVARHLYSVQTDGSGMVRLTPDVPNDWSSDPHIADDAGIVVFNSTGFFDPVPLSGIEVFATPIQGGPITRFFSDGDNRRKYPRVDAAGQWVVLESTSDFDGMNPNNRTQVLRARVDGSLVERLTAVEQPYWAFRPDISAGGDRIVFTSTADLTGSNPDHDAEIFLYEPATATMTQLTNDHLGEAFAFARISGDGAYVYFSSKISVFESVSDGADTLYRLEIDTGVVERASGLRDPRDGRGMLFAVDGAGGAVFIGAVDAVHQNSDFSREFWRVDFGSVPAFEISSESPTVLSWAPDPRYVRYDVIRGDVASLSPGSGGTSVDLGTVSCLSDDSPVPNTSTSGDPAEPNPGQAFFYLYRGTQGSLDGPGSWGQGTPGERVVSSGSCDP